MGAIAGALALALALSACGGGDSDESPSPTPSEVTSSDTPSATPTVEPETLTDLSAISVSDDWGTEPTIDAPYPFEVDETMSKVIIEGDGTEVPSDTATVNVHYVGMNARSGALFDSSWINGAATTFPLNQLIPGFAKGVVGQKVGSRVAIAITSSDGYDPNGQIDAGINPGDTLLFIVDILDSELAGPEGEPSAVPDGLPSVSETDGVPAITIPADLAEPTSVGVQPLIQGSGRALEATDALTSHAVCSTWDGTEYYNDYGSAAVTDAVDGGAVHQALFNALVGQQLGSRVLVTLPGDQAYPNGNKTPSMAPSTAAACVVDILYTQSYSG